jgi:hypothetical protein
VSLESGESLSGLHVGNEAHIDFRYCAWHRSGARLLNCETVVCDDRVIGTRASVWPRRQLDPVHFSTVAISAARPRPRRGSTLMELQDLLSVVLEGTHQEGRMNVRRI